MVQTRKSWFKPVEKSWFIPIFSKIRVEPARFFPKNRVEPAQPYFCRSSQNCPKIQAKPKNQKCGLSRLNPKVGKKGKREKVDFENVRMDTG